MTTENRILKRLNECPMSFRRLKACFKYSIKKEFLKLLDEGYISEFDPKGRNYGASLYIPVKLEYVPLPTLSYYECDICLDKIEDGTVCVPCSLLEVELYSERKCRKCNNILRKNRYYKCSRCLENLPSDSIVYEIHSSII